MLRHEGKYSNDKDDGGCKTKYGISQKFLNLLHSHDDWKDFHDYPKDARDIIPAHSVRIQKEYFAKRLAEINPNIRNDEEAENLYQQIFDVQINHGEKTLGKI